MTEAFFETILTTLRETTRALKEAEFAADTARWERTPETEAAAAKAWAAVRAGADRLETLADGLDPERAETDRLELWAHLTLTTRAAELRAAAGIPA